MTTLLSTKAFHRIPPANIQAIFMRLQRVPYRAGDVVIKQGDEGDFFYVIVNGKCVVTRETPLNKEGIKLAELGVGDTFGEEALIAEAKRNATVTMLTDGVLMRLNKQDFRELMNEPLLQWVSYDRAREIVARGGRWLDVRLPSEHQNLAIEGSLNIPLYFIRLKLTTLDRKVPYVVYCDTGRRSSAAAYILVERGFDAYVLTGGLTHSGIALRAPPSQRLTVALRRFERASHRALSISTVPAMGTWAAALICVSSWIAELHRMRGLVAGEGAGQIGLDLLLRLPVVLLAELHADAGGALALRALGGHPDHPARHRQLLVLAHEVEQHEHLIPQAVVAVGRDEEAAVLHERHVGQVQRALVLDGERQQARLVPTCSQSLFLRLRSGGARREAAQQALERQSPVDRRVERRLELPNRVQEPEKLAQV